MNLRAKLLILFIAGGLAPVLLVGLLFYRNSLNVVEEMLREEVKAEAERVAHDVEAGLREREADLNALAQAGAVRDYARGIASQPAAATGNASLAPGEPDARAAEALQNAVADFVSHNRDYYSAVTPVSASQAGGGAPVRVAPPPDASNPSARDSLPGQLRLDERVWAASEPTPLRSGVTLDADGTPCIVYTVPVFSPEGERSPRAALVAELKLDALLQEAVRDANAATPSAGVSARAGDAAAQPARLLLVLDRTGKILHHTDLALKYQPAGAAMPYFHAFASAMRAGKSGTNFYTLPTDGTRWLASYKPIAGSDLSVAAAGNYTRAVAGIKRGGLASLVVALLVAGAATLCVFAVVTRAAYASKTLSKTIDTSVSR